MLVEKPGEGVDCEGAAVVGFTPVAGIYNKCGSFFTELFQKNVDVF